MRTLENTFCKLWKKYIVILAKKKRMSTKPHHSLTFVPMAARKPRILKLSSLAEQRARPPMTGIRDRLT